MTSTGIRNKKRSRKIDPEKLLNQKEKEYLTSLGITRKKVKEMEIELNESRHTIESLKQILEKEREDSKAKIKALEESVDQKLQQNKDELAVRHN